MSLSAITLLLAIMILFDSVILIVRPEWAQRAWMAFSRNRIAGWVITAIGIAWAAWLLWHMPLGRFESLKSMLFLLAPVTYILVLMSMSELLAARALGGLFVLLPTPILTAARWHSSPLRLVMIVIAYIIAIKGLTLVLSPYMLNKWSARLVRTPKQCRLWGVVGTVSALVLLALAIFVY
ncbi:MAG: hypothetical protein ISS35_04090 [Kiritimatiellae bacterium]|nr:hypothetical protein [Kiritimatiellia bacterium]